MYNTGSRVYFAGLLWMECKQMYNTGSRVYFAGLLWMECKQMYNSGLRVYLLDNYNWMDFTLLSLYLASYALRFLVDHWIKQSDKAFR